MARPRVFVSSTYYDLKHLRAALEGFIASLGFEPILSEKHSITYTSDVPLDQSCYRVASSVDIFVLIVGGRYGSPSSKRVGHESNAKLSYESVTRAEYETAIQNRIPSYILIEQNVFSDFETFRLNSENKRARYAHVDSRDIFTFISHILTQPLNNPVCKFSNFADIEHFLRNQWAGLFQELLRRHTEQVKLATLSAQVNALATLNDTLRTYIEAMLKKVQPAASHDLIEQGDARLRDSEVFTDFAMDEYWSTISQSTGLSLDSLYTACRGAVDVEDLVERLTRTRPGIIFPDSTELQKRANNYRRRLSLSPINERNS